MTNEQELRKLKAEAQELKELYAQRDAQLLRMQQRIDAALERKPKWVRHINGSVNIVAGKWYKLIDSNQGTCFLDECDSARWPVSSSSMWEYSYDDAPPAEEPRNKPYSFKLSIDDGHVEWQFDVFPTGPWANGTWSINDVYECVRQAFYAPADIGHIRLSGMKEH